MAFCRNLIGSKTAASLASTAPCTVSEWPARYFVTLWTTMSAPSSNGCWKTGSRERIIHNTTTQRLPRRACASLLMATMSLISRRGFVGVSIQTKRVLRRKRRFDCLQAARIDLLGHHADRLKNFIEDAVRAAINVQRDDDLVAGAQIGLQHGIFGGESRRERRSMLDAFERSQHSFEALARGIIRTRIGKAFIVAGRFLLVRGGLENRGDQRARFRL